MTRRIDELRAGVVGTGFIGVVHVDALRRLGVEVTGVVGSTPERAASKRLAPAYESYEALLDDDARRRRPPDDAEPPAREPGQGGARGRASTSSARSRSP